MGESEKESQSKKEVKSKVGGRSGNHSRQRVLV